MSRRYVRLTSFEARSLLLIASVTLGVAGSAYAQSTAAPAKPAATDTEITAAFTKADKNSDGKLSRDESATLPALAAKFDSADTDKDGTINATEFSRAMKM